MKFIVVERPTAPVFFAAIAFNVGSSNEVDGVDRDFPLPRAYDVQGHPQDRHARATPGEGVPPEEDELAAAIAAARREIGAWRLEIFDGFARDVVASFPDEVKQAVGSDKIKETEALIESAPSQAAPARGGRALSRRCSGRTRSTTWRSTSECKRLELALAGVQDEHQEVIVEEEFWDIYTREGGRMLNAFTSNDITAYIVYLPSNRLELWMSVEADRLANPVFRETYQERDVIAEELRLGQNDPDEALWDAFTAAAFEASPYGRTGGGLDERHPEPDPRRPRGPLQALLRSQQRRCHAGGRRQGRRGRETGQDVLRRHTRPGAHTAAHHPRAGAAGRAARDRRAHRQSRGADRLPRAGRSPP